MIKLIISASNFGLSGVVSAVYNLVKHLVYTSRYEIIVIGEDKAHYSREFEKLGVRCILIEGIPLVKSLKLHRLISHWKPNIFMPGFCSYEYIYLHRVPSTVKIVQTIQSDHIYWYQKFYHVNKFADAIVFVSDFLRERLESQLVCLGTHIPNFVHVDATYNRNKKYDSKLHIVYTGRFVQEGKRVLDIPEILKAIPDLNLHLAGDGGEKFQLFSQLDAYGIDYTHHGLLRPQELSELYKSSDLFIMTSAYEGLPLSLIEAMSFGCVPLVTKVRSGVTKVVDENNGYLVDIGDIAGFRKVLFHLVADRQPLRQKGMASTEWVARNYSAAVCGERYERMFAQILGQPSTHPKWSWLPRPLPGTSLLSDPW